MCCIDHKTEKLKIAKKDVIVYKILSKSYWDGHLLSPCRGAKYKIGKTKKAAGFNRKYGIYCYPKITRGDTGDELYKCIIPKGSEYYIGRATWGPKYAIRASYLKVLYRVNKRTGKKING